MCTYAAAFAVDNCLFRGRIKQQMTTIQNPLGPCTIDMKLHIPAPQVNNKTNFNSLLVVVTLVL